MSFSVADTIWSRRLIRPGDLRDFDLRLFASVFSILIGASRKGGAYATETFWINLRPQCEQFYRPPPAYTGCRAKRIAGRYSWPPRAQTQAGRATDKARSSSLPGPVQHPSQSPTTRSDDWQWTTGKAMPPQQHGR